MKALNTLNALPSRTVAAASKLPVVVAAPAVRYRTRDFGVGYGNSSGYADGKRYTSDWGAPRFRCS